MSFCALHYIHYTVVHKLQIMGKYRNNGAIGAILDEYEKALTELKHLISELKNEDLIAIF